MFRYIYSGCFSWARVLFVLVLMVMLNQSAIAHLMVAQRGTLNIVDDGIFMVLSLPVSAFSDIDDDGDGKMSLAEFSLHRSAIVEAINDGVQLYDQDGVRPLEGMMLSPVTPHDEPESPVRQLVVMGRFLLKRVADESLNRSLVFKLTLFGTSTTEQEFQVTAKYPEKSKQHKIMLTPKENSSTLFAQQ